MEKDVIKKLKEDFNPEDYNQVIALFEKRLNSITNCNVLIQEK